MEERWLPMGSLGYSRYQISNVERIRDATTLNILRIKSGGTVNLLGNDGTYIPVTPRQMAKSLFGRNVARLENINNSLESQEWLRLDDYGFAGFAIEKATLRIYRHSDAPPALAGTTARTFVQHHTLSVQLRRSNGEQTKMPLAKIAIMAKFNRLDVRPIEYLPNCLRETPTWHELSIVQINQI